MSRTVQTRPDIQVFAEISAIDQMVTRAMERALPGGLSRPQYNLMSELARDGDHSPGSLARALVLTKGAVTHLLGKLEARGLVEITGVASDQRRKSVKLTAHGTQGLRQAQIGLGSLAADMRRALAPEGFSATLPLLADLRRHLSETL